MNQSMRAHSLSRPRLAWAWFVIGLCAVMLQGCDKRPAPRASPPNSVSYWLKSSRPDAHTAIVFVHGVMGDSSSTWRAPGAAAGWPELIRKEPALPPVDVLALGYQSPPIGAASNIEEIAVRSLRALRDDGLFSRYDNVIFVVHSMGGLITKRMLKTLQGEDRAAFDKIRAVVFFATPAKGSDVASLAEWVTSNPQFRDMAPSDFSSFLQVLENDWQALLKNRSPTSPFPRSYCAYEKLPEHGVKVIVPRSNAETSCDETPVAFDRDHASIVKPASETDEVHVFLRARILAALDPNLVAQRVTVKVIRANGEALRSGETLHDGDQYAIELSSTRRTLFYVFAVDSTSRPQRLFPSPAAGGQSSPMAFLRVPQDGSGFFTLDRHKGLERLYIFARLEPDAQLAAFGSGLGKRAGEDRLNREDLDRYFMTLRGVGLSRPGTRMPLA